MNHFSNKKFNLIKFGKGAIAVSSLALPALIPTTTNAMIRNPKAVSTLFITLGRATSSSSSTRSIGSIRTSNPSSAGIGNPAAPRTNLSGEAYRKMANINTGGSSSLINNRINSLQSSSISTTSSISSPTPLPIPKGSVSNVRELFSSTFHATRSSGFSNNTSPSGNVALLSKNFSSSSTTGTTSSSGSSKTSSPSGNVALLSKNFSSSSTTSTTSPSSSGKSSSPSGNVALLTKNFSSSSTTITTSPTNSGKTSAPASNVARLARNFTSSSTSTTPSPSSSGKTSAPSGNVARLARNFTSSSTSTTSSSSSSGASSSTGKVARIAKMFGN